MFTYRKLRLVGLAVTCVGLGAGVSAIAAAGAASSTPSASSRAHQTRLGGWRFYHRAVHGDLVVPTKSGFVTVTFDRGTIQTVTGNQLTIVEGTKTATYKTVTLTIPSDARVRVDGKKASVADLKAGQRVLVVQGPQVWHVRAR
jgi:hypothetical protein